MRPVQSPRISSLRAGDLGLSTDFPILPDYWIRRDRLDGLLPASASQRFTVVTGPAGAGKSLLVAGWLRAAPPGARLWVALRRGHGRDPDSWSRLAAEVDWDAFALRGPDAGGVLVLDNLDAVATGEGSGFLGFLGAVPDGVRVVLVGRHVENLPLMDLRLRQPFVEIDGAALDFTVDEVTDLHRMLGRPRSSEVATAALARSEGWALGLRLESLRPPAATPMDAGRPPLEVGRCALSAGEVRLLGEFFEREVLTGLPAEVRGFLREISVAPRLSTVVAEAISGRQDAGGVLERLAAENRFVRRVGESRFALHRLFAEVLLHELSLEGAERVAGAHRRAAAALEATHEDGAAARQLVASNDFDHAFAVRLRMLRQRLEWQLGGGGEPPLPGGLPDHYLCADPWRMFATCVALLVAEDLDEAAMWLVRLEVAAALPGAPAGLALRLHRLRALHALASVDAEAALEHVSRAAASAEVDGGVPEGPPDRALACIDADVGNAMACVASRAHAWLGQVAEAREALGGRLPDGRVPLGLTCAGALAALALAEGRLREALEVARQAIGQATLRGSDTALGVLDCRLVAARVLLERDELAAASQELREAEALCSRAGHRRWAAVVRADSARLAMEERRFADALHRLDEARRPEVCGAASPLVERRLDEVEVRCRLLMGDPVGAARILAVGQPELRTCELDARLHLASGRPDLAMNALSRCRREPAPAARAIERAVLRARCHAVTGNRRAAEQALQEAVDAARSEGFARVFRDEPALLAEVLRGVVGAPDAFLQPVVGRTPAGPAAGTATGVVLEPLTRRERELLDFLPSHLSQFEIARRMYLSANTVKTHMKGLYRKLGVSSRSEAVDAARACGLL